MTPGYWAPALVSAVCQVFGIGLLGVYGFFVAPLSREFGVGVATVNIGPVFLLLAPALVGPLLGRYVDRYSIRTIVLTGVVAATVSLFGTALAPSLLLAGAGFMVYAAGQTLFGPLVLNSLLIKTYQDDVARALAIAAMGVSVGSVLMPFLAASLLDNFDWREALQVLALGVGCLLLLVVRLGLKKSPGDVDPGDSLAAEIAHWGLVRSVPFWIIGLSMSIIFNMALMLAICYAPHFSTQGFSNNAIATFMAAGGSMGFLAKLLVAGFVDRWRAYLRSIAIAVVCVMILGMGVLLLSDSYFLNALGVALIGGSAGAFLPLHPYLNSRYFAPATIGGVSGAQAPLMLPLGLVSAPLAGYAFDVTGSYRLAILGAIVMLLVAVLLLLVLPAAKKPQQAAFATAGAN